MNDYRAFPIPTGAAQYGGSLQQGTASTWPSKDNSPCVPPQQPRFDQIADDLSTLPGQAYNALQRLRSIADRYGGSAPEAVAKDGCAASSSAIASRLEGCTAEISNMLAQIHAQIDRLERF